MLTHKLGLVQRVAPVVAPPGQPAPAAAVLARPLGWLAGLWPVCLGVTQTVRPLRRPCAAAGSLDTSRSSLAPRIGCTADNLLKRLQAALHATSCANQPLRLIMLCVRRCAAFESRAPSRPMLVSVPSRTSALHSPSCCSTAQLRSPAQLAARSQTCPGAGQHHTRRASGRTTGVPHMPRCPRGTADQLLDLRAAQPDAVPSLQAWSPGAAWAAPSPPPAGSACRAARRLRRLRPQGRRWPLLQAAGAPTLHGSFSLLQAWCAAAAAQALHMAWSQSRKVLASLSCLMCMVAAQLPQAELLLLSPSWLHGTPSWPRAGVLWGHETRSQLLESAAALPTRPAGHTDHQLRAASGAWTLPTVGCRA